MRGTIDASNVPQGIVWMHVSKSQRAHAQARQKNIKSDFKPSNAVDQPINTGKGYQLDLVDRGDFWKGTKLPVRQD